MGQESPPLMGRTQAVLAACVQAAALAGALCFVIGVALISTVFGRWGVNFLQVASTADVIGSGLDIVARMTLPLLLILGAGAAGWRFPARRLRVLLPVIGLCLLALTAYLAIQHLAREALLELQRPWDSSPASSEPLGLSMEADFRQMEDLGQRLAGLQFLGLLVAACAQMLVAYGALSMFRAIWPGTKGWTSRRAATAALIGGAVAVLPVLVFLDVVADLSERGFHDGMILSEDCDPRPDVFDAPELLWIGERAMAIRCLTGEHVRLGPPEGEFGPPSAFAEWMDIEEEKAQAAQEAALDVLAANFDPKR